MRLACIVTAVACTALISTATAVASPVATSNEQYQAYGAVFPDPLAVCQQNCDPRSRGRVSATQFIQWQEFNQALQYMNTNKDWQRYMEVLPLDGHKGDGAGTKPGDEMWPGNNLSKLEFEPKKAYQSAGIPRTDGGRQKSDIIVIRVTDENVPDKDKKRYALSLSIHGIERAGAEGGIRAMEEFVTAVSEGRGDDAVLPKEVRAGAPSFREVLANAIIYFTLPNPDGWRRGSVGDTEKGPGVFFQRYNGNGVDPNRDWPDIGFSFRRYSGGSEPETRALQAFYRETEANGGQFSAGDDLHGQPFADALSYTLMPHGRHDLDKDYRIREASKLINRAQYNATKWSPIIQDNDQPLGNCEGTPVGDACTPIYAQTWGSVYDTINYTTTGAVGDWFDSATGLGADGIDNEMSFSHLDRNIAFEPQGEQLHVAANKAIIFSHISDLLSPPGSAYSVPQKSGYVANTRLTRAEKQIQPGAPEGTSPDADLENKPPDGPSADGGSEYNFDVHEDADTWNGGMRVDVTASNVQGIGSGLATLKVQCQFCDEHVGVKESDEWITVAEDYNQGIGYAQAGLTAAVNHPDAKTGDKLVHWRAVVDAPGGVPMFNVHFMSGPATTDGATEGDSPPRLAAYDVANTDFFTDLNEDAKTDADKFDAVDPAKVISGEQSLDSFKTLVLADEALPGYNGAYAGQAAPTGPPTKDLTFPNDEPTTPGQGNGCTGSANSAEATDEFPFTIGPNDLNRSFTVKIEWKVPAADWALAVFRVEGEKRELAGSTDTNPPATKEELQVQLPVPGDYVAVAINCAADGSTAADPFTGTITFEAEKPPAESTFTVEQKDAWIAKLKAWVEGGGNLVLTDGALKAVSELTSVPGSAIRERVVYVGQTAFKVCDAYQDDGTCETDENDPSGLKTKETLDDPLSKNVAQFGARFNTGMRRQTYEPTPLGFAIQNDAGGDQSFARQFDIVQKDWQDAGGRAVGGSADSGARDAQAVPDRTTLGEIGIGKGRIRILGALLPQPSEEYDHPLGIEPYSVTYTGYILFCNLVGCSYVEKSRPALPNPPAPPGPVELGFDARLGAPLLASQKSRNGRRIPLRIRATGRGAIDHFLLQYRRTGRGTKKVYKTLRPHLRAGTKKVVFGKGKLGETYLFRLRAIGKTGTETPFAHTRVVFPYDDRGKGRRYSKGWRRVKNAGSWRGGYSRSSRRGATLEFITKGGGRVYLVARTGPNGGKALVGRGSKKRVVSFRSKKRRNRQVVTIINRTDKRAYRFRLKVLKGTVTVDGIGVRRR